jgi:uncharacterized protein (TIGR02284 family)
MQLTDKDVSAINDVISICKDAETGFRGAADSVNNPSLKTLFNEYSSQRATFARELESAVERSGAKADHPSGMAGKLHSGWMHVKATFTGHSDHEILEETERGEDHSVKTYREALGRDLPQDLRLIVRTQFEQVQEAHNNIRRLRDETAH